MAYCCVATSVAGFIQQLAVGYISNGSYFYVAGVIPSNKSAARVDAKILAACDIAVSKWTRVRRMRAGQANVQHLRHGRFYVIVATHGVHSFFSAEAKRLRDIRKTPILFMNYSIGCRREHGGEAYHASVRINRDCMRECSNNAAQPHARHSTPGRDLNKTDVGLNGFQFGQMFSRLGRLGTWMTSPPRLRPLLKSPSPFSGIEL